MGLFAKGQSGNPGGRPKAEGYVRALARSHTEIAIRTLVDALGDENSRVRVVAAIALLDRGWGRPGQPVEFEDKTALDSQMDAIRQARERVALTYEVVREDGIELR